MTEDREQALRRRIEALEHDNASLRQHLATVSAEAFQAGRAYERRQAEQARRRAMTQTRQLGGGLVLVVDGFDQRAAGDDFDQTPRRGEEAA